MKTNGTEQWQKGHLKMSETGKCAFKLSGSISWDQCLATLSFYSSGLLPITACGMSQLTPSWLEKPTADIQPLTALAEYAFEPSSLAYV